MSTGPEVAPAVKLLAEDHGIDLDRIAGTGPNNAITVGDVSAFLQRKVEILAMQGLSPVAAARRDSSRALSPATAALSDKEANDLLWKLGCRAGLTPPDDTPVATLPGFRAYDPNAYELVMNADGSGSYAKRASE